MINKFTKVFFYSVVTFSCSVAFGFNSVVCKKTLAYGPAPYKATLKIVFSNFHTPPDGGSYRVDHFFVSREILTQDFGISSHSEKTHYVFYDCQSFDLESKSVSCNDDHRSTFISGIFPTQDKDGNKIYRVSLNPKMIRRESPYKTEDTFAASECKFN